MPMHNPPHPGLLLREWIPETMSITTAASELKISRVTLSKIINGNGNISADMALRLSLWLGTSAEFWLSLQVKYDLWQAEQKGCPFIARIAA